MPYTLRTSLATTIISFVLGGLLSFYAKEKNSLPLEGDASFSVRTNSYKARFNNSESPFSRNYIDLTNKSSGKIWELLENPQSRNYQQVLASYFKETQSVDIAVLLHILENWGKREGKSALVEFEKMQKEYSSLNYAGEYLKTSLLDGWVSQNPEAAAQYYKENSRKFYSGDFLSNIVKSWGYYNPRETLKWFQTLNDDEQKKGINGLINAVFSKKDESLFKEFCTTINSKHISEESTLKTIASQILTTDESLIDNIAEGEAKTMILEKMMSLQKINAAYDEYKTRGAIPDSLQGNDATEFLNLVLDESKNIDSIKYNLLVLSNHFNNDNLNKHANTYVSKIIKHSNPNDFYAFAEKFQNSKLTETLVTHYMSIKLITSHSIDYSEVLRLSDLVTDPDKKQFFLNELNNQFIKD